MQVASVFVKLIFAVVVALATCSFWANAQQEPKPEPYSFGYSSQSLGALSSHQESGDGSGRVTGFYTIMGDDGRARRVDYVADENGYRAQVSTNEMGTRSGASGSAVYQAQMPSQGQLDAAKISAEQWQELEQPHLQAWNQQQSFQSNQQPLNAGEQQRTEAVRRYSRQQAAAWQESSSSSSSSNAQQPQVNMPQVPVAVGELNPIKNPAPETSLLQQQIASQFLVQAKQLTKQDYPRRQDPSSRRQQQQQVTLVASQQRDTDRWAQQGKQAQVSAESVQGARWAEQQRAQMQLRPQQFQQFEQQQQTNVINEPVEAEEPLAVPQQEQQQFGIGIGIGIGSNKAAGSSWTQAATSTVAPTQPQQQPQIQVQVQPQVEPAVFAGTERPELPNITILTPIDDQTDTSSAQEVPQAPQTQSQQQQVVSVTTEQPEAPVEVASQPQVQPRPQTGNFFVAEVSSTNQSQQGNQQGNLGVANWLGPVDDDGFRAKLRAPTNNPTLFTSVATPSTTPATTTTTTTTQAPTTSALSLEQPTYRPIQQVQKVQQASNSLELGGTVGISEEAASSTRRPTTYAASWSASGSATRTTTTRPSALVQQASSSGSEQATGANLMIINSSSSGYVNGNLQPQGNNRPSIKAPATSFKQPAGTKGSWTARRPTKVTLGTIEASQRLPDVAQQSLPSTGQTFTSTPTLTSTTSSESPRVEYQQQQSNQGNLGNQNTATGNNIKWATKGGKLGASSVNGGRPFWLSNSNRSSLAVSKRSAGELASSATANYGEFGARLASVMARKQQ